MSGGVCHDAGVCEGVCECGHALAFAFSIGQTGWLSEEASSASFPVVLRTLFIGARLVQGPVRGAASILKPII